MPTLELFIMPILITEDQMPFLNYEDFEDYDKMTRTNSEMLRMRDMSAPKAGASIHEKLVHAYIGRRPAEPALHIQRTLDQFQNPLLAYTAHYDADQVAYRYSRYEGLPKPKILTVDQLWLWTDGGLRAVFPLVKFFCLTSVQRQ